MRHLCLVCEFLECLIRNENNNSKNNIKFILKDRDTRSGNPSQ